MRKVVSLLFSSWYPSNSGACIYNLLYRIPPFVVLRVFCLSRKTCTYTSFLVCCITRPLCWSRGGGATKKYVLWVGSFPRRSIVFLNKALFHKSLPYCIDNALRFQASCEESLVFLLSYRIPFVEFPTHGELLHGRAKLPQADGRLQVHNERRLCSAASGASLNY